MNRPYRAGDYVRVVNEEHSRFNLCGFIKAPEDDAFRIQLNGAGGTTTARTDDLEMIIPVEHKFDGRQTVTKDNLLDLAEWCDGRIVSPWKDPHMLVKTGFAEDPNFQVTVEIGDQIEYAGEGKWQVWINPNVRVKEPVMEDRAEMLEHRGFDPQHQARNLVWKIHYGSESEFPLDYIDVYVVWFCKTLQNWKAMVSTNAKDDAYYEVTHNGDKNETYVDRYVKETNTVYHGESGITDMTLVNNFGRIY